MFFDLFFPRILYVERLHPQRGGVDQDPCFDRYYYLLKEYGLTVLKN